MARRHDVPAVLVSRLRSSVRCAERSLTVAARIRAARVSKRVLAKRMYSDGLNTSRPRFLQAQASKMGDCETLPETVAEARLGSRLNPVRRARCAAQLIASYTADRAGRRGDKHRRSWKRPRIAA